MLVFLKLGGSLITNKNKPFTALDETVERLAFEIAAARAHNPSLKLIIGHGSGSFGHVAGKKFGTRDGVNNAAQWSGFVEVWSAARKLNNIVVSGLEKAGLPIIAFPPSAAVIANGRQVQQWNLDPIRAALQANIIPLVNGDVCFDRLLGGTILSTEDLFFFLAAELKVNKILLAGIEKGVWKDFPACTQLVDLITPLNYADNTITLGGAVAADVTGGMAQKVDQMISLIKKLPELESIIFSGAEPDNVTRVLAGENIGTMIRK